MFPGLQPTAQCVPRWKEHSLCQSLTKFAQILPVMSDKFHELCCLLHRFDIFACVYKTCRKGTYFLLSDAQ
jgi:hypothetical protein